MNDQWSSHLETLSLTEIIRVQNHLSATLTRRFERPYALIFSDIVGSTAYFSRFGDVAGGRLQQQHFDLLSDAMIGTQGQFFHTAGDGALLGLPAVETAADTMVRFHQNLRQLTYRLPSEQQWTTRAAIHWGQILIDGKTVAGDTVNLCAKVAATAQPGEIRVTKAAFAEFPNRYRFLCQPLGLIPISSANEPVELMRLSWHDALHIGSIVRLANVMTLQFLSVLSPQSSTEVTTVSNTRLRPG